jgi:hypothetical protein
MANIFQLHFGSGNQIVLDPQAQISLNKNRTLQEQIQMLTHRPSQSVLHRNHGCPGPTRSQRVKNFDRPAAGKHISFGRQLRRSLMAESAAFSLDGNFHYWL